MNSLSELGCGVGGGVLELIMAHREMDPGQVASIVGHKSLAMIYSHYNQLTSSDAARALMAALRDEE